MCLPGTYSLEQTNLAPCEECEKDTFQAHSEQNFCLPCDDLYGTVGTGAEHCLSMCVVSHCNNIFMCLQKNADQEIILPMDLRYVFHVLRGNIKTTMSNIVVLNVQMAP